MASQSTLSAFALAAESVNGAKHSAPAIAASQPALFAVRMNEWRFFITLVLPDRVTDGTFGLGVSGVTREVYARYRDGIGYS